MANTVLETIEALSQERRHLLAREGAHHPTGEERQRILRIEHDLEVLWDLRRRELEGDYYDGYTVDPGADAPPPAGV